MFGCSNVLGKHSNETETKSRFPPSSPRRTIAIVHEFKKAALSKLKEYGRGRQGRWRVALKDSARGSKADTLERGSPTEAGGAEGQPTDWRSGLGPRDV